METVLAYITAKDKNEAKHIGKTLVEKRLAACVNVIPGMESFYWWEGKIDSSSEAILIAKTSREKATELIQEVKKLHSYSVPCVLILPVKDGNPAYLNWLADNLQTPIK